MRRQLMQCLVQWLCYSSYSLIEVMVVVGNCIFFQAEDGIRDLVRSRGLGDVYKRQRLAAVEVQPAEHDRDGDREEHQGEDDRSAAGNGPLSLIHI